MSHKSTLHPSVYVYQTKPTVFKKNTTMLRIMLHRLFSIEVIPGSKDHDTPCTVPASKGHDTPCTNTNQFKAIIVHETVFDERTHVVAVIIVAY